MSDTSCTNQGQRVQQLCSDKGRRHVVLSHDMGVWGQDQWTLANLKFKMTNTELLFLGENNSGLTV